MPKIVAAAIRQDGMVCFVPRPGRHSDVIRAMARSGIPIPIVGEQGFLTSTGFFVDRKRAKDVAIVSEQVLDGRGKLPELFSEDLW